MAAADYRLCDVCGHKVFYDSNLNYEQGKSEYGDTPPFRTAGEPQAFTTPEAADKWGMRLDWLGDWAVICEDCAKTHKCIVVPIAAAPAAQDQGEGNG
jgi:hypothetical protein